MNESTDSRHPPIAIDAGARATSETKVEDANSLVRANEILPYPHQRDKLITSLALFVIGLSALSACFALVYHIVFPPCNSGVDCDALRDPTWPAEMLRLSLVSSLAFVMGARSSDDS